MAELDSIFDEISKSSITGGGKYIVEGCHRVTIDEVKIIRSRNPKKNGTNFLLVAVTEVEHSQIPTTGIDGKPVPKREPGEKMTWRCDLGGVCGGGNAKQFFLALGQQLFGASEFTEAAFAKNGGEKTMADELMAQACGTSQIAKGADILIDAYGITTREGKPFTKVIWRALDQPKEAQVG